MIVTSKLALTIKRKKNENCKKRKNTYDTVTAAVGDALVPSLACMFFVYKYYPMHNIVVNNRNVHVLFIQNYGVVCCLNLFD